MKKINLNKIFLFNLIGYRKLLKNFRRRNVFDFLFYYFLRFWNFVIDGIFQENSISNRRLKYLTCRSFPYGNKLVNGSPEISTLMTDFGAFTVCKEVGICHPRSVFLINSRATIIDLQNDGRVSLEELYYLPYRLRKFEKINQPVFCRKNIPENNYYHLILDQIIPYLFLRKRIPNLLLAFPYSLNSNFRNFLDDIGINYFCADSEIFCDKAIIANNIVDFSKSADFLKNFKNMIKKNCEPRFEKLFINRRHGERSIHNGISDIISKYKFKEVFLEDYSVEEQANLVSGAAFILAVHGAGITNIIFADKPNLFEILPNDPEGSVFGYGGGCFKYLCEALGGTYHRCIGGDLKNGEFEVDTHELDGFIHRWIAETRDSMVNTCFQPNETSPL